MKTYLLVSLLATFTVIAGCAAPADKKTCDEPQIQRELGYTAPGCEQTS
ncbi:hypothetical protein [Roseateles sp. MS654]